MRLSDFDDLHEYFTRLLLVALAALLATRWARSSYQAGIKAGLRFVHDEGQVDAERGVET